MVRVMRKPPEFCPKCHSAEIAATGAEKILTSPSGMPWQEGWSWKCGLRVRVGPARL
jgi:hypothetical protein